MPDAGFLDWPFFDAARREHAARLEAWAGANLAPGEPGDVDAACRGLVAALGEAGWLRACVPASHGGLYDRLDVRTLCLSREILARHRGLADFSFVMQGLGSGPIGLFGTDAQKDAYLPGIAAGRAIAAFALSEPEAGSDVAALAMTAERDGDAWVLNGEKTWISNGGIADVYTVIARTGEAPGAKGLSAFVVEASAPGLSVAERIEVSAPHPLARLSFADCRIPAECLIGEPGQGFKIAMGNLDVFRATVGAAALGFARAAFDAALDRLAERRLFGAPMAELQILQGYAAEMATDIDASALLVYRAAHAKDSGAARVTREASMAKLFATEAAQRVIDKAVQIFGGLGVTKGSLPETLYREIRALRIYEGASEVQKVIIARQALAARARERAEPEGERR